MTLGIDLGGTNIAAAVVDENYNIVGRGKVKTALPRPAEEICDAMAEAAKMAIKEARLEIADIADSHGSDDLHSFSRSMLFAIAINEEHTTLRGLGIVFCHILHT